MGPLRTVIRLPLYISLWVCSAIVFVLTCVRLNYTLHLPKGDPLNNGRDFYDPIVAELLVVSLLTLATIPLIMDWVPRKLSIASNNVAELSGLAVLWLLWLVGCTVSTSIWPNLNFCYQFEACRILAAMMAFSWLGWIALVGLIIIAILNIVTKARQPPTPIMVEWASSPSFVGGTSASAA